MNPPPDSPRTRLGRGIALSLAASVLGWGVAAAQPGNIKSGETIYLQGVPPAVAACASCHGAKAEGGPGFPPLAGNGAAYTREQLDAFAGGQRVNAIMKPMANAMDEQARADVAAYLASLPNGIDASASAAPPDPGDQGAWLVERGRWSEHLPACASCHGPGGTGVGAHFPAIGKLDAAYMQAQIEAWKNGQRQPGLLGLMQEIAKKLSKEDVQAVADYYARLANAAAPSGAQK